MFFVGRSHSMEDETAKLAIPKSEQKKASAMFDLYMDQDTL